MGTLKKSKSFIFEYKRQHYLKFEEAKRRAEDNFGNTHTVYVNSMIEDPENVPAKPKRKAKQSKVR